MRVGNGWGVGRAGVGIAGGNGNSWGGGIFLEWEMKWLYCEIVGVGNDWGEKWLWWEMVGIQNSCTLSLPTLEVFREGLDAVLRDMD